MVRSPSWRVWFLQVAGKKLMPAIGVTEMTRHSAEIEATLERACAPDCSSVDAHYLTLHGPAAYAERLRITPTALARRTKKHFARTPTQLIQERLVVEAKKLPMADEVSRTHR